MIEINEVLMIYKTDTYHSYTSRDLIGVVAFKSQYNAHIKAIRICKEQAEKEGETIEGDQLFNLNNIQQTQGYSGEGEFQFESVTTNELL